MMASSAQAVFRVCANLCVPACGVLAGAFAAAVSCRRRRPGAGAGPRSAHRRALAAHVACLFGVQLVRVLYLFRAIPCPDAVPVLNYIELSAFCWLHTICINFVLSFRGNHSARDSHINFLFGLAYAWCTPMILLVTLERHVEGKWLAFPDLLYDVKTCLFDEPPMKTKGRIISLQLAILKGITILIASCFFAYLSYKTGFKKRRAVLCQEDSDCISDVNARQLQALKYILTMVATGAVEVTLDVATVYFSYRHTFSKFLADNHVTLPSQTTPSSTSIPDDSARFLLAQWVTLSISLGVDFFRSLVVLELVWWGGPGARRDATGQGEVGASEDSLPPYELATRMPRPPPRPALALALLPPPSYASVFGERGRRAAADDEAALLGSASSSSLALSTPPASPSPAPSPSPPPSPAPAPAPVPALDFLAPLRFPLSRSLLPASTATSPSVMPVPMPSPAPTSTPQGFLPPLRSPAPTPTPTLPTPISSPAMPVPMPSPTSAPTSTPLGFLAPLRSPVPTPTLALPMPISSAMPEPAPTATPALTPTSSPAASSLFTSTSV